MEEELQQLRISSWPHRMAFLLACATFPLVWVGGLVTTTDAGMAVPDWPSTYGYNLFLYPWQTWLLGPWDLFIEHGHRLLAATVGLLTLGLVITLWKYESRRWVQKLGFTALFLVIVQGILGGLRVVLDERLLAMIHGLIGPLFFAVSIALMVVTSANWRTSRTQTCKMSAGIHGMVLLLALLTYLQLVLGAVLRHVPVTMEPRAFATVVQFHVILAAVLALQIGLIVGTIIRRFRQVLLLQSVSLLLAVLLLAQIALGIGTWAIKFSLAHWATDSTLLAGYTIRADGWLQTHIVTAHVAIGSLIWVFSVVLALYAFRLIPLASYAKNLPDPSKPDSSQSLFRMEVAL